MELDFAKLDGLGNDFIFIDDFSREIELTDEQVRRICNRHFGIGGDGVILVRPSKNSECTAYMHYINSDGTLAQMCGNGVRCFAKYLVDRGFVQSSDGAFVADTLAGPRPIKFDVDDFDHLSMATVDMGYPILDPERIPVSLSTNAQSVEGASYVGESSIDSPWGEFKFTCVSMGNPHAVCFLDNITSLPDELFIDSNYKSLTSFRLEEIGAFFESHPLFPEKTNVEFAQITPEGISMRVFERGCGETLACGTGACATLVAAALTQRSNRENVLNLLGGSLLILWDEDDHVQMTGPATESFTGTIDI
ncbi:MAG: diaminopimelate epimerase [Raoultibacter sp.]